MRREARGLEMMKKHMDQSQMEEHEINRQTIRKMMSARSRGLL